MEIRASFHGHSGFSDGGSIKETVHAAARAGIHFLGLTDHNTTTGIPVLAAEIAHYNSTYNANLQMIAGIEIGFPGFGDVIFAIPVALQVDSPCLPAGRFRGWEHEEFLSWAEMVAGERNSYNPIDAIREAVRLFDAFVILAHPGMPYAESVSFETIRMLARKLPREVKRNIALEVRNAASGIFGPLTAKREAGVEALAARYHFATIGSADYHAPWMVALDYSVYQAKDATVTSLRRAVKLRHIRPSSQAPLAVGDWIKLLVTIFQASKRGKKNTSLGVQRFSTVKVGIDR